MRRTLLAMLLVLVSFLPCRSNDYSRSVRAQDIPLGWQALGGPIGRISHLATDGRTLYAVSTGGVSRSDDQTQWREAGSLRRSDALYRSQDNGATWQPASNNAPPGTITALYGDPTTATLFAGTQGNDAGGSALWRSSDQGASWEPVPLGRTGLRIVAITRSAQGRALLVGATDATNEPASTRLSQHRWRPHLGSIHGFARRSATGQRAGRPDAPSNRSGSAVRPDARRRPLSQQRCRRDLERARCRGRPSHVRRDRPGLSRFRCRSAGCGAGHHRPQPACAACGQ